MNHSENASPEPDDADHYFSSIKILTKPNSKTVAIKLTVTHKHTRKFPIISTNLEPSCTEIAFSAADNDSATWILELTLKHNQNHHENVFNYIGRHITPEKRNEVNELYESAKERFTLSNSPRIP